MQGEAFTYKERPQLFQNRKGSYTDVTDLAGAPLADAQVGRGCAWGDFDNDGRPDLLLCENSGSTRLIRNLTENNHHWMGLRLRGHASNRNGYGAEVRVMTGGVTQRRWVRSGSSYLSHSDTRALFGVGSATSIDRVEIRWPGGREQVLEQPRLDTYTEVQEPK
jgi:hypothetical protein